MRRRLPAWLLLVSALGSASAFAQTSFSADVTGGVKSPLAPIAAVRLTAQRDATPVVRLEGVLEAEAVLLNGRGGLPVSDLGSRLAVSIHGQQWAEQDRLHLVLFPLDGRRVRPTHEFLLAWGLPLQLSSNVLGTTIGPPAPSPALLLRFDRATWSVWVAQRMQWMVNGDTVQGLQNATTLAGFSLEASPTIRVQARAAVQDRGILAGGSTSRTQPLGVGGSARVFFHGGEAIGPMLDLTTWRSDPARYERFLAAVPAPEAGVAWTLALETGTAFELRPSTPNGVNFGRVPTPFVDAQLRVRSGGLRLFATARYRPVELLMLDSPFFSTVALAISTPATGQLGGWVGADYGFHSGVRPGLMVRVVQPASFNAVPLTGRNELGRGVLGEDGAIAVVPDSTVISPAFGAKATVRYDLADVLTLAGEVDVDVTSTRVVPLNVGTFPFLPTGQIESGTRWTVWLLAQARF